MTEITVFDEIYVFILFFLAASGIFFLYKLFFGKNRIKSSTFQKIVGWVFFFVAGTWFFLTTHSESLPEFFGSYILECLGSYFWGTLAVKRIGKIFGTSVNGKILEQDKNEQITKIKDKLEQVEIDKETLTEKGNPQPVDKEKQKQPEEVLKPFVCKECGSDNFEYDEYNDETNCENCGRIEKGKYRP